MTKLEHKTTLETWKLLLGVAIAVVVFGGYAKDLALLSYDHFIKNDEQIETAVELVPMVKSHDKQLEQLIIQTEQQLDMTKAFQKAAEAEEVKNRMLCEEGRLNPDWCAEKGWHKKEAE